MTLDRATSDQVYVDLVRPAYLTTTAQRERRAVLIAGQPGSGKHLQASRIAAGLAAVVVSGSDLCGYHPEYAQQLRQAPAEAAMQVQPEVIEWRKRLVRDLGQTGTNLVIEDSLRDSENARDLVNQLVDQGYLVEIRAIAVPALESWLDCYERVERQTGTGLTREVHQLAHDRSVRGMLVGLNQLEADAKIRRSAVIDREGKELYANTHEGRRWSKAPAARQMLIRHRDIAEQRQDRAEHWRAWDGLIARMQQRKASVREVMAVMGQQRTDDAKLAKVAEVSARSAPQRQRDRGPEQGPAR